MAMSMIDVRMANWRVKFALCVTNETEQCSYDTSRIISSDL